MEYLHTLFENDYCEHYGCTWTNKASTLLSAITFNGMHYSDY